MVSISELIERVACIETEVENLKEDRKKQNGTLQKLESKIDKIYFWLIGLMGGMIVSLVLLLVQIRK